MKYLSEPKYFYGVEGPIEVAKVTDSVVICTGNGMLVAGYVESIYQDGTPRILPCDSSRRQLISLALEYVPTTLETITKMPPNTWTFPPPRR